eukprot:6457041-Amphidinium_carterae.1
MLSALSSRLSIRLTMQSWSSLDALIVLYDVSRFLQGCQQIQARNHQRMIRNSLGSLLSRPSCPRRFSPGTSE